MTSDEYNQKTDTVVRLLHHIFSDDIMAVCAITQAQGEKNTDALINILSESICFMEELKEELIQLQKDQ